MKSLAFFTFLSVLLERPRLQLGLIFRAYALILLPVLMPLLTVVFITGCQKETELECYKRNIGGKMFATNMSVSDPLPLEIWGITDARSDYRLAHVSAERFVLNTDGSYIIQASASTSHGGLVSYRDGVTHIGHSGKMYGHTGSVIATFNFEERGTYELIDKDKDGWNTISIKFFPDRVDMWVEDGAYFETFSSNVEDVYLNVEPMNEWLNDVGVYGRTMIPGEGDKWNRRARYSGEEIDLSSWGGLGGELQMKCPVPSIFP